MTELKNRQIFVNTATFDTITPDVFAIENSEMPGPDGNLVVTKTRLISVDPYLSWNMIRDRNSNATVPYPMRSRTIAEVIDPGHSTFQPGDLVLGFGEWREFDARPAADLRLIDTSAVTAESQLGICGHSGFTAWIGLRIGAAKPGETVLISGAAGAVGSAAGQLAKRMGCRVIGIAGGPEKTRYVVNKLGFDACVDHRSPSYHADLASAAGDMGVDVLFENVGANSLDPALTVLNPKGRIALCGLMQHYQTDTPVALQNFRLLLAKSIRLEAFSIYNSPELEQEAHADLIDAAAAGQLVGEQTITEGFDRIPTAFVDMLATKGRGKHLVRV